MIQLSVLLQDSVGVGAGHDIGADTTLVEDGADVGRPHGAVAARDFVQMPAEVPELVTIVVNLVMPL